MNQNTDKAKKKANETIEEIKLASNQLVDRVRELIEEGNVRHLKIKKDGKVLLEVPMTVGVGAGAAAVLLSPMLAALGALAALVTDITLVVERDPDAPAPDASGTPTQTPASKPETDKDGAGGGTGTSGGNAGGSGGQDKTIGK